VIQTSARGRTALSGGKGPRCSSVEHWVDVFERSFFDTSFFT
jgi:hypothetical protein